MTCDLEQARGDWWAEPIQIGLVHYDVRLKRITVELRINVKVDADICKLVAKHSLGLKYPRNKASLIMKKGIYLPTVSAE